MTSSPPVPTTRLRAAVAAMLACCAVGFGLFVTDDPRSGFEPLSAQAGSSGASSVGAQPNQADPDQATVG